MAAAASSYADEDADTLLTDINVTPLVDIVLVLLIVFMITVPTMVTMDLLKERELNISLPQASEARPLMFPPQELVVNVDAAGEYIVDGAKKSQSDLLALLRQAATDNPGRAIVVIRADKKCPWQSVIGVINACIQVKIRDYRVTALE